MTADRPDEPRSGKIVTFYSYKGGTGRSMAMANVAWLLASAGQRVLVLDWDLEAPGLHRFFEPFLQDKSLQETTGLIDFVMDFATVAVSSSADASDPDWYQEQSNILAHATPINWQFPNNGLLHFVPAGRQDAAYSTRVNSFNWQTFYEKLGGGVLLETVKHRVRELYDFILIDSRTGVSDTSGVCTVQMPDEIVVCFTLNRQSIYGAAAAAASAFAQRYTNQGPTLKVWPVPMRIEPFEKDQHEMAETLARTRFSVLMPNLSPLRLDKYWGEIGVHYEPYYAYEEVLAPFKDRPRQSNSLLSKMETIAAYLSENQSVTLAALDSESRNAGLEAFTARSAWGFLDELTMLGREYDRLRTEMDAGAERTEQMNLLVSRAQTLGGNRDAAVVAEKLFADGLDGTRVVGLALARKDPRRNHIEMAIDGIARSRSAFEQYHALLLARAIFDLIDPTAARQLGSAIGSQIGVHILTSDQSRWQPAQSLLEAINKKVTGAAGWSPDTATSVVRIKDDELVLVLCHPSGSFVRYDDPDESHGPFVVTRGVHSVRLPREFRIGRYTVTNRMYMRFVESGAYNDDSLWQIPSGSRSRFLTADGSSIGPASWPSAARWPDGKEDHPVSGVSYLEAQAYVTWLNRLAPSNGTWSLPREDEWEFAARGESGLTYPWGDAFAPNLCNSLETGTGGTTCVKQFEAGASSLGCCDMAGNVWEFVRADDMRSDWCVLRGGSFKNNRAEVRSYLRLISVPIWHRAPDFGLRLCLEQGTALTA